MACFYSQFFLLKIQEGDKVEKNLWALFIWRFSKVLKFELKAYDIYDPCKKCSLLQHWLRNVKIGIKCRVRQQRHFPERSGSSRASPVLRHAANWVWRAHLWEPTFSHAVQLVLAGAISKITGSFHAVPIWPGSSDTECGDCWSWWHSLNEGNRKEVSQNPIQY